MRTLDLPMPWRLPMPADAGGWWSAAGRRLDAMERRHAAFRGDHHFYDCQKQRRLIYFVGGHYCGRLVWIEDCLFRPDGTLRVPTDCEGQWDGQYVTYCLAPALPTGVPVMSCLGPAGAILDTD